MNFCFVAQSLLKGKIPFQAYSLSTRLKVFIYLFISKLNKQMKATTTTTTTNKNNLDVGPFLEAVDKMAGEGITCSMIFKRVATSGG